MRSRTCITGMSKTDFMPGTPRIVASVIVYSFACFVGYRGSDRLLFFYAHENFFPFYVKEARNFFSPSPLFCLIDHQPNFSKARRYERTRAFSLSTPRARLRRKRTARIAWIAFSLSLSPSLCLRSFFFFLFFLPSTFTRISCAHETREKRS